MVGLLLDVLFGNLADRAVEAMAFFEEIEDIVD
jgi:hypothetical protein